MAQGNKYWLKLIAVFILYNACAAPVMEGEDAGPDYTCGEEINFLTDTMNCGGCGKDPEEGKKFHCNPTITDQCKNGQCICSGAQYKCIDGAQECKLGVCAEPDETIEGDPEAINCEFDHQCHGVRMCVLGVCSEVPCAGEDGEPQARSCYSGSGNTYENPPCHKGYTVCFGGHWNPCVAEVLPVAEDGIYLCDRIDNDCDACTDGTWVDGACVGTGRHGADIVFIFDTSPSMENKCDAVIDAMFNIVAGFNGVSDMQFAIILMPKDGGSCESGLLQNFSDDLTFINALTGVSCNNGSEEGSWDVIHQVAGGEPIYDIQESVTQGQDIYTHLSWRPGTAQVIIMFTDEQGQHYGLDQYGNNCYGQRGDFEHWMCENVDSELVAVFDITGLLGYFDECAMTYDIGGGWGGLDESDSVELELNIRDYLGHACD